jgi:hypothetical protein
MEVDPVLTLMLWEQLKESGSSGLHERQPRNILISIEEAPSHRPQNETRACSQPPHDDVGAVAAWKYYIIFPCFATHSKLPSDCD